jgi:hypothetical protein
MRRDCCSGGLIVSSHGIAVQQPRLYGQSRGLGERWVKGYEIKLIDLIAFNVYMYDNKSCRDTSLNDENTPHGY